MKDDLFFSDIDFPGQYYGVLVRSTIQRGHLVDIKPPALPDGYYLYTATDIPGENKLTAIGTSIPIFTPYEIHYLGEPLGILVGPDLEIVHELVAEVLIETETLEPYRFGEKFSSAQIVGKRILVAGDPDSILQNAAKVYEDTYSTGPQDHYYAEPLGAVVNVANGKLEIFTATQWPFHVRASVSAMLDLDPDEIAVTPTSIGEAMDGKIWYPSLIAAQASLAAVLCKRPVKVSFSRQEDFLFSVKSAPVQIRYRTALADDGSIQAMTVRILINSGAYSPLIDEIIDRITVSAAGLYAVSAFRIETYALRTNLPPMGALSGWGEAQAFFALENHISSIVSDSVFSPVEWKLMNTLARGRKSVTKADSANDLRLAELFGVVCTASDFPRKYTAYANLKSRRSGYRDGPVRGIGIACGFQGNGFIGKTNDIAPYSVEITMETDGQVHIKCGFHSPHMRTILCRLAAVSLGIEEHLISFTGNNTSAMSETGPETLSSKIVILAPLVEKCCATIQKQRFRQPLPITVKKTFKPSKNDTWDSSSLQGKPFVSITPGVCAVELELDPLTYEAKIRGIWIACDAGKLYDRTGAMTTIRKTIPAALSRMLAEHIDVIDGKLMPGDSVQYDLLPPSLIPECHITFLDSTDPPRGIGSIAHNLVPAAYAIALSQITGKPVNAVPLDPQAIYGALETPGEES
jgi:CO/xanthine dehydrogenase Mo-binding subunit